MKNRAVRIALFLLLVLAFAAAAYEVARLDRRAATLREAAGAIDEKTREIDANLRELQAAQFAYVATGQGSGFWTTRAAALLAAIATQIRDLDALEKAARAAGVTGTDPAAGALDGLATVQRIDASVQNYMRSEQPLLASDLIFTDLREADQSLRARIEDWRRQLAAGYQAGAERVRKAQMATAAGAAVFALLVLVLLLPAARRPPNEGSADSQPATTTTRAPAPRSPATAATSAPSIDVKHVAVLCTEFARLREASQIPPLLERAAALLDASGIIVWLADAASGHLRPALSFGYAPDALTHIRPVRQGDDNATASAFRDRTLRIVEDPMSNGAIAVPLTGPDGCVGVMAAEIRHGGETRADVQAAATIVAAQLATLVGPTADSLPA